MIQLTSVYILYSLCIVCMYKRHTKAVSGLASFIGFVKLVYTLFVFTENIQQQFQLASYIGFV